MSVLLVAGACSGSALSSSTSASTTSSADTASTITVDAAGGTFDTDLGIGIDVLSDTFPDGAEITVAAGAAPDLPPGAAAVGPGFTVTTDADPAIPVILSVPVPPGASAEDLYLLRIPDEGFPQFIGGSVEDGRFVAAVPGFSTFTLATYDAEELLADLGLDVQPSPADLTTGTEVDEYRELISGRLDRPYSRAVRVVGPGEVVSGRAGVYTALDFHSGTPQFVRYDWTVYGPLRPAGPAGGQQIILEPSSAAGRALVTVEATDPRLGVSAFGSLRVFTLAGDEAGLYLSPSADSYPPRVNATVLAAPRNMAPPYTFEWSTSDGAIGVKQANGPVDVPVFLQDRSTTLTVTVTDSSSMVANGTVGLPVETGDECFMIAAVGPRTATVGQPVTFDLLTTAALDPSFGTEIHPSGTYEMGEGTITVVFGEPGLGSVIFTRPTDLCGVLIGGGLVQVVGDPAPLQAEFTDVSDGVQVDTEVALTLEVTGGVVSGDTGPVPYTASIDWGDGTVDDLTVEAASATAANPASLTHTYAEPGTYQVVATVRSSDGQEATATATIEVTTDARYEGPVAEYDAAASDLFHVTRNRVVVVVMGETVELRRFSVEWEQRYETFDLQGNTAVADCLGVGSRTLIEADLRFGSEGRIRGTVRLQWKHDDTGPECPFGGAHFDRVWEGTVVGSVDGDIVALTFEGNAPGMATEILTVRAPRG